MSAPDAPGGVGRIVLAEMTTGAGLVTALRGRCAVVLATPLVENVAAVCDEVVVLASGHTVFSGTTAEPAGGSGDLAEGYRRVLASTVVG